MPRDDSWLRKRPTPLMDDHEQEMARRLERQLRDANDSAARKMDDWLRGKTPRKPKE